jgi:hypothetical protein
VSQSRKLSSARAYYRLAAKADRAGQRMQADAYRRRADALVREDQRTREYIARMKRRG